MDELKIKQDIIGNYRKELETLVSCKWDETPQKNSRRFKTDDTIDQMKETYVAKR